MMMNQNPIAQIALDAFAAFNAHFDADLQPYTIAEIAHMTTTPLNLLHSLTHIRIDDECSINLILIHDAETNAIHHMMLECDTYLTTIITNSSPIDPDHAPTAEL